MLRQTGENINSRLGRSNRPNEIDRLDGNDRSSRNSSTTRSIHDGVGGDHATHVYRIRDQQDKAIQLMGDKGPNVYEPQCQPFEQYEALQAQEVRKKQELLDRINELEAEVERLKKSTPQELIKGINKPRITTTK